ncbi:MAG TPA: DUF5682 family protein [Tepidisphaeraceae bacterium]|nr:DUF5682 family protein [Tepidisphaeraceae bacterium]
MTVTSPDSPLPTTEQIEARVDALLRESIYWMPVRHHSPTVSSYVRRAILERRPKVVFIEAPAEAQCLAQYVIDKETRPPVAIYSCFRDDDNVLGWAGVASPSPNVPPRFPAWYPFTVYSPEYVAMQAAAKIGAEAIFIDLPHYATISPRPPEHSAAQPKPRRIQLDELASRSSFYRQLARAAGFRSFNEAWDSLFESDPAEHQMESYRRDLTAFCCGVRASTPPALLEIDGTLARERHMWQAITATLKSRNAKLGESVVVCGGFHVFLDQDDPAPPPAPPAGTISVTLTPYGFFRISEFSGYGAGNRAPQFYQKLWEMRDAGSSHQAIVIDHIVSVLERARKESIGFSSADAISATQHAGLLSTLRNRRSTTLDDIRDALVTCCVKGEVRADGGPLLEAMDELEIGTRLGRVTGKLGRVPILTDFYDQLDTLQLKQLAESEKVLPISLDLRRPLDASRSAFCHRLKYLGIEIGGLQRETNPLGQSLFKEHWRLQWSPKLEAALIERVLHGDTVEAAAISTAREKLAACAYDASEAARQLTASIDMDLPALVAGGQQAAGQAIDADGRFTALASALSSLLLLDQYAEHRHLQRQRLSELIERCYDRACFALPDSANVPDDQQAAVVKALQQVADPVLRRDDLDRAVLAAHAQTAATNSTQPYLRGALLGLLAELRQMTAEDLARELHGYAGAAPDVRVTAGDFLLGVLTVSRTAVFVGAESLVAAIDELLASSEPDIFLTMLPRLRAAMEQIHDRQRDKLAESVARRYGLADADELTALQRTSPGAAALIADLDHQAATIMKEWGL